MKQTSSGNPYSQILHHMPSGSQVIEDGDVNHDANVHNGINFASRLQQFEHMQHQHRMHSKSSQAQSRNNSTSYSSSKVCLDFVWYSQSHSFYQNTNVSEEVEVDENDNIRT